MKILTFCLVSILAFPGTVESAKLGTYVVKEGDTLSQIAQTYIGSPVYPNGNGSLKALVSLNPALQRALTIYPGQVLVLSAEHPAVAVSEPSRAPASRIEGAGLADSPPVESKQEMKHQLTASARYGLTSISATDTTSYSTAKLFSKRDLGISLGWKQDWSESFSTEVRASLRDIDFEPPTSSAKVLSSSHKTIPGLELRGEHIVSNRLVLLYRLKHESRLFVRGANAVSVVIDAVPIPEAGAEFRYDFLKRGSTTLGLAGGGGYLFSGAADSYAIRSGFSYSGGLVIAHQPAASPTVSLSLTYQNRTQDTNTVRMREGSVLGAISFGLAIFEAGVR